MVRYLTLEHVRRPFESAAARVETTTEKLQDLIKLENDFTVMSLSVSIEEHDITMAEAQGVAKLIEDMQEREVVQDACCVMERGEKEHNLHCQIMMQARWKKNKEGWRMQEKTKDILIARSIFERSFTCGVIMQACTCSCVMHGAC